MIYVSCLSLPPRWPCCPGRWATGSPGCEHIGLSESALRLWQWWEASRQIQAPVFLLQQHLGTRTSLKHPGRKLLGKRTNSWWLTLALSVTQWFSKQLIQAMQAWAGAFQGETDWGYSFTFNLFKRGCLLTASQKSYKRQDLLPVASLNCAQNLQETSRIVSLLTALFIWQGKSEVWPPPSVSGVASNSDYTEAMRWELEGRESSSGFTSGIWTSVCSTLGRKNNNIYPRSVLWEFKECVRMECMRKEKEKFRECF